MQHRESECLINDRYGEILIVPPVRALLDFENVGDLTDWFVCPRDIREGSLDLSGCLQTTQEEYEDLIENHRPAKGDVVYGRNATFGVGAIVETNKPFAIGQEVCIIVGKRLRGRLLFYLLNSPIIRNQLNALSAGSTFKRINLKDIRRFAVLLIPDVRFVKISYIFIL